ncbi:hypothetical protein [Thermoanaerobacterium sp. R66]|uniref:hypothetical protein n=1 Tax=Thermoanaerobacterium sp. R66 TaxID=2742479 RepID=UPI0023808533|nr:hypothetical protein [Thermoanaerobacterium sp. R66]MDE4543264.1 hypothetical protein [Thermoanaerobacterium sp. R66]
MLLRKRLKNSRLGYQLIFAGALLISFIEIIIRYKVRDFSRGLFIGVCIGLEILGIIAAGRYNKSNKIK